MGKESQKKHEGGPIRAPLINWESVLSIPVSSLELAFLGKNILLNGQRYVLKKDPMDKWPRSISAEEAGDFWERIKEILNPAYNRERMCISKEDLIEILTEWGEFQNPDQVVNVVQHYQMHGKIPDRPERNFFAEEFPEELVKRTMQWETSDGIIVEYRGGVAKMSLPLKVGRSVA